MEPKLIKNIFTSRSKSMPSKLKPNSVYFLEDSGDILIVDSNGNSINHQRSLPGPKFNSFSAANFSGDPCSSTGITDFPLTLWHNGSSSDPEIGDTIYSDENGNNPKTNNISLIKEGSSDSEAMVLDSNGVAQAFTCR